MKVVIGIILLLFILLVFSAAAVFVKGCGRRHDRPTPRASAARPNYDQYIQKGQEWFFSQDIKLRETLSHDGLKLSAYYLQGSGPDTLILMHGYHSEAVYEFAPLVRYYHSLGYSLLLPDQRAHGKSEGRYLSFGIKECKDVVSWAAHLNESDAPDNIFLSGISMGGATVCMAALQPLPENVRGIIADCPFGDPGEQFRYSLSHLYRLPAELFVYLCGIWSRILGKWHFTDFSATDYKDGRLPMLIIHGTADTTVPHKMSEDIAAHYGGPVQRELFEGCAHSYAYLSETDRYQKLVTDFFLKHKK